MTLTDQQTATILAALRHWQESDSAEHDFPDHFEHHQPLTPQQIDTLCEAINFQEDMSGGSP